MRQLVIIENTVFPETEKFIVFMVRSLIVYNLPFPIDRQFIIVFFLFNWHHIIIIIIVVSDAEIVMFQVIYMLGVFIGVGEGLIWY